jgi:thymidine phosphorylase
MSGTERHHALRLRRLGIDTQQEAVVYMRADCHVCRAEGFRAHARIGISRDGHSIIATLHHVTSDLLRSDEAGLSEAAWRALGGEDGDQIWVEHPPTLDSLSYLRTKVYGNTLDEPALHAIIRDVAAGRYADVHLASFITACAGASMSREEVIGLTRAMIGVGDRLNWGRAPIVDKHCVGGLPGNRTSPIVVAIVTACGLTMPKTSSRAITSPAGTADTMETLAPVDLDVSTMRKVVDREGGCVVWGGAVRLSPADDILIRVERALDVDSEGQLVASVLSKKAAAGSTHLVLDVPVGPTAKARTGKAGELLRDRLLEVAHALGVTSRVLLTDGTQPVGRGIGPALEARDVLAVLRNDADAPADLRVRAISLAGALLELASAAPPDGGENLASAVLDDGRAWRKFQAICEAQGGMRTPPRAAHTRAITSPSAGSVTAINNRLLARAAKLAGAPDAKAAGLELHVKVGDAVQREQPLFTLHAENRGELVYALDYVVPRPEIVQVEPP